MNGLAVVKIFFQPNASVDAAIAQVTATSQTILRQMPPGVMPPLVMTYNASSVPILQLGLSSPTLSEQQLGDLGLNFIRTQLVTIPGASVPYPYGGKQRQVMVDLNPALMQSKGISPQRCGERVQPAEPDPAGRARRRSGSSSTTWISTPAPSRWPR